MLVDMVDMEVMVNLALGLSALLPGPKGPATMHSDLGRG